MLAENPQAIVAMPMQGMAPTPSGPGNVARTLAVSNENPSYADQRDNGYEATKNAVNAHTGKGLALDRMV